MNYDNYQISSSYNIGRNLPDETMNIWLDKIELYVPKSEINYIIDLGCGTGRFTSKLMERYYSNIVGIDPSEKMLFEAKKTINSKKIDFQLGNAEHIPINDNLADLIYLSMVYHHINNRIKAIHEIKRVLKANKYVFIRNSTIDLLDQVPYLNYFPTAIDINKNRLPYQKDIIELFCINGFQLIKNNTVKQMFSTSGIEYYEKIKQRSLSDLTLISDEEYNYGINKLYDDFKGINDPIFESIDYFVFRKI